MTVQQLDVGGPSGATRDSLVWNTEALSGHQIDSRLSGVDGDLFLKYFQVRVQTYSSRRYVFFALGLANSDSELWTAAGDNLSDALLGAAAAITIRVGDLSLTVPGPNHSSYSTADDSEPYHWRWDFPVTETGHPSRAVSDFLAGFSELSGEERSRTQIVLSDQDVFTEPTLPPPSVLVDAASVNLDEPLDLSSAGYNDVLRLGIKPSSEDQVFRIWATLAYSVEGSVAGSRVGSRLVRNGDVNLSQILHPASSEMVRFAARTPKYFFVCDAPGMVEEVTYALSLFESEAAGASPRAQRGLSLYVEALSGEFEVVEKFVADSLPPDRVVTPAPPITPPPVTPPITPPVTPQRPGSIASLTFTRSGAQITATWAESSDADEYKIQWLRYGNVVQTLYQSSSDERTATRTFEHGQPVGIRVQGLNNDRKQKGPSIARNIRIPAVGTPPAAPGSISSLTLVQSDDYYTLTANWSAAPRADEYELVWKVTGFYGDSEDIYNTPERTWEYSRFSPISIYHGGTRGDTVKLEVRGLNHGATQEGPIKSRSIDTTIPRPGKISSLTVRLSADKQTFTATWGTSSHAESYEIDWYRNGSIYRSETIDADEERTDSFDNFYHGDTVKAVVRGTNDGGGQKGPDTTSGSTYIPYPIPEAPDVTMQYNPGGSYDRVEGDWPSVDYAASYEYKDREEGGSWLPAWEKSTGLSYRRSPVVGNKTYYLQVRAINDDKKPGAIGKDEVKTPKPDAPTGGSATFHRNPDRAEVDWDDMDLATRYRVRGKSPNPDDAWSRWYYITDSGFTYSNFHLDAPTEHRVGTWRWEVQSGAYGSNSFSDSVEISVHYPGPANGSSLAREAGEPTESHLVPREAWEGVPQKP